MFSAVTCSWLSQRQAYQMASVFPGHWCVLMFLPSSMLDAILQSPSLGLHGDPGSLTVAALLGTQTPPPPPGGWRVLWQCCSGRSMSQRSMWSPRQRFLASLSSLGPGTSLYTGLRSETRAGRHAPLGITSVP